MMILWLNQFVYNVTLIVCAILTQSILYLCVCVGVWMYAHNSTLHQKFEKKASYLNH